MKAYLGHLTVEGTPAEIAAFMETQLLAKRSTNTTATSTVRMPDVSGSKHRRPPKRLHYTTLAREYVEYIKTHPDISLFAFISEKEVYPDFSKLRRSVAQILVRQKKTRRTSNRTRVSKASRREAHSIDWDALASEYAAMHPRPNVFGWLTNKVGYKPSGQQRARLWRLVSAIDVAVADRAAEVAH